MSDWAWFAAIATAAAVYIGGIYAGIWLHDRRRRMKP